MSPGVIGARKKIKLSEMEMDLGKKRGVCWR